MKKKSYIVEMTDEQLRKFKKLLKEQKATKTTKKKKMSETLLTTTLASFHVFKIGSFKAAKRYANGCKWSLCILEDMFDHYTKDYDFYIIHCGGTGSYALLTNKDTYKVREIRNNKMERLSVEDLLEQFNGEEAYNNDKDNYTIDKILDLAIYKE